MLINATRDLPFRSLEGRLSGGFEYKPLGVGTPAGAAPGGITRLRVRRIAALIEQSMATKRTPALQHASGVAQLLLGDERLAVESLQQVLFYETGLEDLPEAARRSNNGPLLNDLSVALHARGRMSDVRLAVEVAARAQEIWRNPESSWNFALALDTIDLDEPALRAWQSYEEADRAPKWRAESARRIVLLSQKITSVSWNEARPRLEAAFTSTNSEAMLSLVLAFPQQAREWVEETAFPQWARSRLAHDPAAARQIETIAVLAAHLRRVTGDSLMHDHTVALRRSELHDPQIVNEAAAAHLAYQRGRELYGRSQIANALVEAQRSLAILQRRLLPFRHAALLTVASCEYIRGNHDAAAALVTPILDLEGKYPSAAGRAHWVTALTIIDTGDPRKAIAHYERAVELFTSTREADNRAAATTLLAQAQDSIGLSEESWQHRFEAFALHSRLQTPRWRHGILIEAAMAAVRSRDLALARLLLERLVAVDTEAHDVLGLTAALRVRSMLYFLTGDEESASADLTSARAAASKLTDPVTRTAIMHRLTSTAAMQLVRRDPVRALQILTSAQSTDGTLSDVAEMSMGMSEALLRDPSAATNQLLTVIDRLEARLNTDDRSTWQSPLVIQPLLSLYDEAVALLVANGHFSDALVMSERARLSVRRLNGRSAVSNRDWSMPDGTAAIVFYVNGDDVISWMVVGNNTKAILQPNVAKETRRLAAAMVASPSSQRREDAARRLGSLLLEPHWSSLSEVKRLVIVPDAALWLVPFAALRVPGGHVLAENFIIELAGSLAEYRSCVKRTLARPRTALLAGASRPNGNLPALAEVTEEIASVQRTLQAAGVRVEHPSNATTFRDLARDAYIIHFAGHAVLNADDPALSYLALDSGERLYARDIRQWKLGTQPLVVLSSCEGAVKGSRHLDAWSSISDAFVHAGAAGVIAAMTPVDDQEASLFAVTLYSKLDSFDPPTALNAAQRSAVGQREWGTYAYITGNCH